MRTAKATPKASPLVLPPYRHARYRKEWGSPRQATVLRHLGRTMADGHDEGTRPTRLGMRESNIDEPQRTDKPGYHAAEVAGSKSAPPLPENAANPHRIQASSKTR